MSEILIKTQAPVFDISKAADDDGGLSIKQFREFYNISTSQTYIEMAEGRLVAKKIGKRTIIPRANARAWLEAMPDRQRA